MSSFDKNFCDEPGAECLKDMIQRYWLDRGFSVDVHLRKTEFNLKMRAARFDVRSDMVNGLPPTMYARMAGASPSSR